MADLIELYEKARLLNLQNLAHGKIELNQETVSNIDYLDYILSQELEFRRQAAIKRHTNASRLPKKDFDQSRLKPGIAWQVEQLENMQWIDEGQNLVIIGKCDTGSTYRPDRPAEKRDRILLQHRRIPARHQEQGQVSQNGDHIPLYAGLLGHYHRRCNVCQHHARESAAFLPRHILSQ